MRHHTITQSLKMLLGMSVLMCFSSVAAVSDPFTGWGKAGYNTDQYQTGFLEKLKDSGRQLGFIKSLDPSKRGFGTLMRTAGIEQFKGKRIELVSYIKTSNAKSAGAWFRVNGEKTTLAFDNMSDRRIHGTKDWQKVSLVLDIPVEAVSVSYGILLEGDGKVWFEQPTFGLVDLTVKITERSRLELDDLQMENKHFRAVNEPNKTPRVRNSSKTTQDN